MSELARDPVTISDSAGSVEDAAPSRVRLGLVMNEPLSSVLKVERAPPPMRVETGRFAQAPSPASLPRSPVVTGREKLADAAFVVQLSELAVQLEAEVAESGQPDVQAGFDEVCKFLMHCEHLRLLQQN